MVKENFTLILGIARTFLNCFTPKYEEMTIEKEILYLGHSKLFGYNLSKLRLKGSRLH
jgi:hypothetical protein